MYDIRIVATGTDKEAKNVGFTVTAEAFEKTWDKNTTTVYKSLNATDSKGNTYEAINAEDKGAAYVYAMVIKGVPADADVNFSITPYKTDAEGKKEGANGDATVVTSVVSLTFGTNGNTIIDGGDTTDGVWALTTNNWCKTKLTVANSYMYDVEKNTGKLPYMRVLYSIEGENGTNGKLDLHTGGAGFCSVNGLANTDGFVLSDSIAIGLNLFLQQISGNRDGSYWGWFNYSGEGKMVIKAIYFCAPDGTFDADASALFVGTHFNGKNMTGNTLTLTSNWTQLSFLAANENAKKYQYARICLEITGETENGTLVLHDGGKEHPVTGFGTTEGYGLSNTLDLKSYKNSVGESGFYNKLNGIADGSFYIAYKGTGTCTIKAIYFFATQAEADAFELPTA